MFGISAAQVREFYNELRRVHGSDVTETDYRRVQSSLCICSLNCTWEQLYDVQRAWIPPDAPLISIRTLRDDFTRVPFTPAYEPRAPVYPGSIMVI